MATDLRVPVQERAESDQLSALLRSGGVQELMAGRIDAVRIVRVRSYKAKCFAPWGKLGFCWAHFNAASQFEDAEWVVTVCHELGHLVAGLQHRHGSHFRGAWSVMVSEAGELGLLTKDQVMQATRAVLFGPATIFRGWPENAARRIAELDELLDAAADKLGQMRVVPGAEIAYRHGHGFLRGQVQRVNRRTITVRKYQSGPATRRTLIEKVHYVLSK